MNLDELIRLITNAWPNRLERGVITHIHQNHLPLDDGTQIHLRVLIQRLPAREADDLRE
jgi:hypothetical protein